MRYCKKCARWTNDLNCPVCSGPTEEDSERIEAREATVTEEVENCPFCGAKGFICGERIQALYRDTWSEFGQGFWISCFHKLDCPFGMVLAKSGGWAHPTFQTKEEAVKNWNRRSA